MKIKGETLSQCVHHEIRNQIRRIDRPLEHMFQGADRGLDTVIRGVMYINEKLGYTERRYEDFRARTLCWVTHRCLDCGTIVAATPEYLYMVHNHIWEQATGDPAPGNHPQNCSDNGMLCISCLERRLGYQLCPEDFKVINPELSLLLFGMKEEGVLLVH